MFGSATRFVGIEPVTSSGATSLSTFRCCGVPYSATVREDEPTNVRIQSQWPVSLTNLRSVSG